MRYSSLTCAMVLMLFVAPAFAAAEDDGVRTYFINPSGGGCDGMTETWCASGTRTVLERSDTNIEVSASTAQLVQPLTLAAVDTFRLVLPDRTPIMDGEFATRVRVVELDESGDPVYDAETGTWRMLGSATFTVVSEDGSPVALVFGADDTTPVDDWRDMRFALDPALLVDGATTYTVPVGHRIGMEMLLIRDGQTTLVAANDAYRDGVLPIAGAAFGAMADVLAHEAIEAAGRQVPIAPEGVAAALQHQMFNNTNFQSADQIFSDPTPVSWFTVGDAGAPARLEIRSA